MKAKDSYLKIEPELKGFTNVKKTKDAAKRLSKLTEIPGYENLPDLLPPLKNDLGIVATFNDHTIRIVCKYLESLAEDKEKSVNAIFDLECIRKISSKSKYIIGLLEGNKDKEKFMAICHAIRHGIHSDKLGSEKLHNLDSSLLSHPAVIGFLNKCDGNNLDVCIDVLNKLVISSSRYNHPIDVVLQNLHHHMVRTYQNLHNSPPLQDENDFDFFAWIIMCVPSIDEGREFYKKIKNLGIPITTSYILELNNILAKELRLVNLDKLTNQEVSEYAEEIEALEKKIEALDMYSQVSMLSNLPKELKPDILYINATTMTVQSKTTTPKNLNEQQLAVLTQIFKEAKLNFNKPPIKITTSELVKKITLICDHNTLEMKAKYNQLANMWLTEEGLKKLNKFRPEFLAPEGLEYLSTMDISKLKENDINLMNRAGFESVRNLIAPKEELTTHESKMSKILRVQKIKDFLRDRKDENTQALLNEEFISKGNKETELYIDPDRKDALRFSELNESFCLIKDEDESFRICSRRSLVNSMVEPTDIINLHDENVNLKLLNKELGFPLLTIENAEKLLTGTCDVTFDKLISTKEDEAILYIPQKRINEKKELDFEELNESFCIIHKNAGREGNNYVSICSRKSFINTECDLILMRELPPIEARKDISIQSSAAYVRCYLDRKLFYVKKANKEVPIEINLSEKVLKLFDDAVGLKLDDEDEEPEILGAGIISIRIKILTEMQLKEIRSIIGHIPYYGMYHLYQLTKPFESTDIFKFDKTNLDLEIVNQKLGLSEQVQTNSLEQESRQFLENLTNSPTFMEIPEAVFTENLWLKINRQYLTNLRMCKYLDRFLKANVLSLYNISMLNEHADELVKKFGDSVEMFNIISMLPDKYFAKECFTPSQFLQIPARVVQRFITRFN